MGEIATGPFTLGTLVLVSGFLSVFIERFPVLSRPMLALSVGLLLVIGSTQMGRQARKSSRVRR